MIFPIFQHDSSSEAISLCFMIALNMRKLQNVHKTTKAFHHGQFSRSEVGTSEEESPELANSVFVETCFESKIRIKYTGFEIPTMLSLVIL